MRDVCVRISRIRPRPVLDGPISLSGHAAIPVVVEGAATTASWRVGRTGPANAIAISGGAAAKARSQCWRGGYATYA